MSLFSNRWKAGVYFKCLVKKQLSETKSVTELVKPSGVARTRFMEYLGRSIISLTLDSPEVVSSIRVPPQEKHDVPLCEPWPDLTDEVVRIAEEILAAEGELPHMQRVVHLLCRQGIAAKLDWLLAQIDAPDVAVVVFAHYRDSLDAAAAALEAAGLSFVRVDGDTAQEDRPEITRRFQAGEVQVFLGQTTAAGIAIDLYRAQVSVCLDHSWKAVDYTQALARTRRIGQSETTHHFDLCANELQQRIIERVRDAADFDAECAAYQHVKRAISSLNPTTSDQGHP
jgi:SNF2 family DNA or RNA helicase